MEVCDRARAIIKSYESLRLQAYPDPCSPLAVQMRLPPAKRTPGWQGLSGEPWTVGYGSTGKDRFNLDENGKPTRIGPNTTWTKEQAEQRFKEDVQAFADEVERLLKVKLTSNQFGALVSLAYNIGTKALSTSALLQKLNNGDFDGAADQFLAFNKGRENGKLVVMKGLIKRRQAERELFLN